MTSYQNTQMALQQRSSAGTWGMAKKKIQVNLYEADWFAEQDKKPEITLIELYENKRMLTLRKSVRWSKLLEEILGGVE